MFGLAPTAPTSALAGLFGGTPAPAPATPNILALLLNAGSGAAEGPCRSRSSWNDRFTHWERPESVSEGGTIERAKTNVSAAIADNSWLNGQRVRVEGQGSYFNRTNVRREADIDLRVVHPLLKVDYADNVYLPAAQGMLGYSDAGPTFQQIFNGLRVNLAKDLSTRFGRSNVEVGKKAIRIKGITGSRAEVDVVPAIRYHHVTWLTDAQRYLTLEGVAILSTDGRWTVNFPDQHAANGRAKRGRTGHQFKRTVRIFKRMQADMLRTGAMKARVPSFLVECLVYAVEDPYFTVPTDDRYGRVRRVAWRIKQLLSAAQAGLTEINDIKWLFHADQAWNHADALAFADAAIAYLGDA
ncbi:hypothetical protein BSL82_10290 [Tardibacter chloracetimidivorans]|uniref:cGAS/DncV-like nucleotidyltransferase C-terminal helical domain-containing protein n=1 Tax=Tardibacter chloracetimidivorans TaxID=1921510 RepID=A0A1L3ZZM4_9SPHN|nr:hypothetical protein BSL82_10290 [Tardibacter chloracetimidivorans]